MVCPDARATATVRPSARPRYRLSRAGAGATWATEPSPTRQTNSPSSARNAARSPPSKERTSQPVSQYGGAATVPGSTRCQRTAPVAATSARTPPGTTTKTSSPPTAGAKLVGTSTRQRAAPVSRSRAVRAPSRVATYAVWSSNPGAAARATSGEVAQRTSMTPPPSRLNVAPGVCARAGPAACSTSATALNIAAIAPLRPAVVTRGTPL